jgi:mono/diheme cytochrome c family protein
MQLSMTSLRRIVARVILLGLFGLAISACHLDMYDQPKYTPLEASDFFKDGASARRLVDGTVSRNGLKIDERTTGRVDGDPAGEYVTTNPISINEGVLARGEERYKIYCASCHGVNGNGKGIVAGPYAQGPLKAKAPALFYVEQLRADLQTAPDGYYFDIITHGKQNAQGEYSMWPAASRIQNVDDRWSIIAYIREMQKNPPAQK